MVYCQRRNEAIERRQSLKKTFHAGVMERVKNAISQLFLVPRLRLGTLLLPPMIYCERRNEAIERRQSLKKTFHAGVMERVKISKFKTE